MECDRNPVSIPCQTGPERSGHVSKGNVTKQFPYFGVPYLYIELPTVSGAILRLCGTLRRGPCCAGKSEIGDSEQFDAKAIHVIHVQLRTQNLRQQYCTLSTPIFSAENQITQMDGGAAVYAYDGEGRRMKKTVGSETKYYYQSLYGQCLT